MRQTSISVEGPGDQQSRKIAFTDWGDPDNNRVLFCAHGLTRNGRDFDAFAEVLSSDFRVICPDAAGRGKSDWLDDREEYGYPLYVKDTAALMTEVGAAEIDWVGTSMGGFLGMMLAASKTPPIRRMVVNDIGPFMPQSSLVRIAEYLGGGETFADVDAVEVHIRNIHATFGPLTDAQWRHMAEHSYRTLDDGKLALHYDPEIAHGFRKATGGDIEVWKMWDFIKCPVLALRGENSDVLPAETAREMTERGPRAHLMEFTDTGHAPALVDKDQIAMVRDWLIEA